MKKIKVLLSALAMVAAMAFVSCGGKAGDDGTSSPAATDSGDIVVFDPATYTGDIGEVVEVGGEKYLKVTPNKYSTSIALATPVDIKGKTSVACKVFAEAGQSKNADCQFFVSLNDAAGNKIYEVGTYKPIPETAKDVTARHFVETQWNKASTTDICSAVQPIVQDATTQNYDAMDNIVVYFGKIIAK